MTKPTRATPESGSTPLSSRVDPILTPAKAEREAAANRSVDTSDTLKQTVTKATPSVSDETLALFGRRNDFATRYHLTRRGKIKRLGQITRIVEQFDVLHGLTPVKMRLMFEALGPTFVKVGQILSMRSEILPQSFCDELANLVLSLLNSYLQVFELDFGLHPCYNLCTKYFEIYKKVLYGSFLLNLN